SGCEGEPGGHPLRVEHRGHRFAGGPLLESAGSVEDLRQEREIARGVEEDAGHADHPVDGPIDVGLILERLVPRRVRLVRRGPRAAGDRLDDLDGHVAFAADGQHFIDAFPVALVLRHEEVVGHQDRVEVEARQAAPVHDRDRPSVTGHADESCQPLLAAWGPPPGPIAWAQSWGWASEGSWIKWTWSPRSRSSGR